LQTDNVLPYINWAVANKFGVIDICFPQFSNPDLDIPDQAIAEAEMTTQCKELLCYIWDNYLGLQLDGSVTVMGVGDACVGVKQLLLARGTFLFPPSTLCFTFQFPIPQFT
jgi:histone deacetylase 6